MKTKEIIDQLHTFRSKNSNQKYAFLFTKKDLNKIGINISHYDGIRIYMGQDGDVITSYAVPVKFENGIYDDVLDTKINSLLTQSLITEGRPCPTVCGGANILNT